MTMPRGLDFHRGHGQWIVTMGCEHQHGRLYVIEGAEMNWVETSMPLVPHSLAGFFRELVELQDPRIKDLMQRWGLYYRQLPLEEKEEEEDDAESNGHRQVLVVGVGPEAVPDRDAPGVEAADTP